MAKVALASSLPFDPLPHIPHLSCWSSPYDPAFPRVGVDCRRGPEGGLHASLPTGSKQKASLFWRNSISPPARFATLY
jgi:hypothetical protein